MTSSIALAVLIAVSVTILLPAGDQLPPAVSSQHNPGKRSEIAIDAAEKSLDQARVYYKEGQQQRGEEELELIARLADECLSATQEARKSKYWKKSELGIAALHRRLRSFTDELSYDQRDKANELAAHLDSIHDKLLAGVMGK
jgi:hypothetical protein